ncbi:MAG: flippase-like domain-containing protein [Acidobacteriia bacterium]|nr:flippase-like domain-containing protein [Terriglobia bacterium]
MKKKILITVVLLALAALIYLQFKTWRKFDWQSFREQTEDVNIGLIALGVAIIHFDYFLRALRWKILLRPVCDAKAISLLAPTMIGFTGMALLGRPGEFIRPFLIARKVKLTMSSQLAVWVVERLFDVGAFAIIMAVNILVSPGLKDLPGFAGGAGRRFFGVHVSAFNLFQGFSWTLLIGVLAASFFAFRVRRNPERVAGLTERLLKPVSPKLAHAVGHRVHTFGEGLNTIQDAKSFVQAFGLSLLLWITIGATYVCVMRAYDSISAMTISEALLLTGASVAGGVLQLPVVGGGSQLATIGILVGIFQFSKELSISCGMMLWLVTFMSVIPAGLVLAHFERVSFTKLEVESKAEEEKALADAHTEG